VPWIDFGPLRKAGEALERVVQRRSALGCLDGEIGAGSVTDQERIAGQEMPVREETAMLRPVPRCVEHADRDVADRHLVAVLDRLERVFGLGERMDADRDAVLEGEAPVPGE